MVTKKENIKETHIVLNFDFKTIEDDIKQILKDIGNIKKQPFHDIFLSIPKKFPNEYLFKLVKDLKYKDFLVQKNTIIIQI
jgi:hypothetical protein